MADNIVFNDLDVTVEIYDSVIAKWVLTDYLETNPASTAYLRNRDSIQPKLTAGLNVTISDNNEISADFPIDQVGRFVSSDLNNELKLGTDQLLYVGFSGLLRNGGDVETRGDLPDTSAPFIAHMIKDENLIVFAYQDVALGLAWLPLSFYVDMNLYVSKGELPTEAAPIIEAHNTNEGAHPFILTALEEIREEMVDKEHFRGYYATTAEVLAITNPETGDFAYNAQTGTKWVYDSANGWYDSLVLVPDQMVEPYDGNPLMDGVASSGSVNKYSRGDHRHATDTSRAPLLHSSSATSYGVGNANLYGHLKLSDALNSTENSGDGVAATPEAVRLTNIALATETSNRTVADAQTLTDAKSYADSVANGVTPQIDPETKHWTIGGVDTGILAQGVDGEAGPKGDTGEQGPTGPAGADGNTPYIESGYWYINGVSTGVKAEGIDGANGITPHIGANLNWWIGETDTGILAQGQNGIDGTDGTNGTDGTDGKEVELQKSATHIQWRYIGDATWIDLVALADLAPEGAEKDGEMTTMYNSEGDDFNVTLRYKYYGETDPKTISIGTIPLPVIYMRIFIEDSTSIHTFVTTPADIATIRQYPISSIRAIVSHVPSGGAVEFTSVISNIGFLKSLEGEQAIFGIMGNINDIGNAQYTHRQIVFLCDAELTTISDTFVDEQSIEQKLNRVDASSTNQLYGVDTDGEQVMYGIDDTPTEDSPNLILSGAVYAALGDIATVLDTINGESLEA